MKDLEAIKKELRGMIGPEMACCKEHYSNGWNDAIREILERLKNEETLHW